MAVIHSIKNIPFEGDVISEVKHTLDGTTIYFESGKSVYLHTYGPDFDYSFEDYYNDNINNKRNKKIEKLTDNG